MNTSWPSMSNKTCIVTGSTSGTGYITALELARAGATVIMICRNETKGKTAQADIREATNNDRVELLIADMGEIKQVREVAAQILQQYSVIDVLVNNAGGVVMPRKETSEGLEAMFAGNYLGHFQLTLSLLPLLKKSEQGRIINVSSSEHSKATIHFDDLQLQAAGAIRKGYGQSKLAQVLFTYELAERLKETQITVNALHPGAVVSGFVDGVPPLFRPLARLVYAFVGISAEKGADTINYLAMSEETKNTTGKYFVKRKPIASSPASNDRELQSKLFSVSEKLLVSL